MTLEEIARIVLVFGGIIGGLYVLVVLSEGLKR